VEVGERDVVAGRFDTELAERRAGEGRQAMSRRRILGDEVARDGEDAAGTEVLEEGLPALHGVERVLGEHERARCGRRPAVDQRDLDDVEGILRARHVAARLVVHEAHLRVAVEMAGEVAEPAVHDVEDGAVHLERGHRGLIEHEGREHVAPASAADHEHVGVPAQMVGEVGEVVAEVVERPERAVERCQHGERAGVDVERQLARAHGAGKCRAHAPAEGAHALVGRAEHPDAGVRVPALEEGRRHVDAAGGGHAPADAQQGPLQLDEERVPDREADEGDRADPEHGAHGAGGVHELEAERRQGRERGHRDDRGGTVGDPQQHHQREAAERGPAEVDRVEPRCLRREARQRQRHADAAGGERDRDHGAREGDGRNRFEGAVRGQRQREVHDEAADDGEREDEGGEGELPVDARGSEQLGAQIHGDRADRHAEHGDRDRQEGEVVPDGHAEDAGQQDLVGERGQGDEEQADVRRGARDRSARISRRVERRHAGPGVTVAGL
jgi:hypothetical protein